MGRILHPLFALLASVTRQDLARQVAYLKGENRILRARLPKRIVTTPQERTRLLKVGRKLGTQLRELMSIASYESFRRWVRDKEDGKTKQTDAKEKTARRPGRPRTPDEIRDLVIKIHEESSMGEIRCQSKVTRLGQGFHST